MTTPSGQISLNDVNVELGFAGTTLIEMNQANVRTLAGVGGSGTTISMQNLQGKSNRTAVSYTYSANTANPTLAISSIGGYSAGNTDVTITVGSGIYLYSTSTGNAGLTLTGGASGDTLTIVNNGFIMGQGGNASAGSGGPALSIGFPATINNTNGSAYIGGGGGGGRNSNPNGGGGAGGAGGGNGAPSVGGTGTGGAGGGIGSPGADAGGPAGRGLGGGSGGGGGAAFSMPAHGGGGGGGRIFAGTGGSGATGVSGNGGPGGSANATGGNSTGAGGSGGGGWGASGGNSNAGGGGGGGKAVNLNGNSVTWVSGNTTRVYGAVS